MNVGGVALILCLAAASGILILVIDEPLNDDDTEKIREYRADYSNRPSNSISFMPSVTTSSDLLQCEIGEFYFWRLMCLLFSSKVSGLTSEVRLNSKRYHILFCSLFRDYESDSKAPRRRCVKVCDRDGNGSIGEDKHLSDR
jgi:hypothetical protein